MSLIGLFTASNGVPFAMSDGKAMFASFNESGEVERMRVEELVQGSEHGREPPPSSESPRGAKSGNRESGRGINAAPKPDVLGCEEVVLELE